MGRRSTGICLVVVGLDGGVAVGRRGPIPNRRDIAERPAEANEPSELGRGEGNLIEGLDAQSFLLVLRDRKSRLCMIERLLNKRSDTVTAALIRPMSLRE
jgi:IS30 family transposase